MLLHSFLTRTYHSFLKDEGPQFWPCLFSSRRCHVHLQSYFTHAGGQILRKKAKPIHKRIADDWFCNSQLWHTHQLGFICRSNSYKQWKGEVTKRTLTEAQRPHWTIRTALIVCQLFKHKPPVDSKMTEWHIATVHQRHTRAKPSKVYPEELGHTLFQNQQSM